MRPLALTRRSTSIAVPGGASPARIGGGLAGRPPLASRCTTVVSVHSVTAVPARPGPARSGPSQNCWLATPRLPEAGTTRVTSTAPLAGSPPLGDTTNAAGNSCWAAGDGTGTGRDAGTGDVSADGSRNGNRSST